MGLAPSAGRHRWPGGWRPLPLDGTEQVRQGGERRKRKRKIEGPGSTLNSAIMKVVGNLKLYNFILGQSLFELRFEIYFKFSKTRI
jgi:hypothetical protein